MSFLSFSKRSSNEDLIIVDVSSGSVGAAAVSTNKNGKPLITYIKRIPLQTKERIQARTLVTETLTAVKELAADLQKERKHTHRVALVLASPWHISHTKAVSVTKGEPFVITNPLLHEIVESETKKIIKEQKEQQDDLILIESNITDVKINGYSTLSPQGKSAGELDLSLYVSLAPQAFLNKIENEIQKSFLVKKISHYTFPFIALSTIQKIFHEDKDFIFIDIASEITDIAAVRNGSVAGTASFPVGINTVVRKVADRFKITPDLAASFVKIYSDGKANKDLTDQIGKLVSAVKEEWLAYFHQVAGDVYGTETLSHKAFVTSDIDISDIALSFTKELFASNVFLGGNTLKEFSETVPHVQHDSFLTIESIYLNLL